MQPFRRALQAVAIGALWLSFATAAGCAPRADRTQEEPAPAAGDTVLADPRPNSALPVDRVELPEGRSDGGWIPGQHLEILCNPQTHRFMLQTSPPQYRSVSAYPKRYVWDLDDLWIEMSGFRGDQGHTASRRSFARCGDYVITVEADKMNWNWRGRGGAHGPYFAVRIGNDFATVYPNEERYAHSRLVPMGTPSALWLEDGTRDGRGCPAQLVSALDVRFDRAAKTTKISLIVEDPPAEGK